MASILNYLPPAEGLLPKWLLFISVVSMANSIQAYVSLAPTQRVYCGPAATPTLNGSKLPAGVPPNTVRNTSPVTPLSARTFGTWTAITAVVRLYAAYHIENQAVYEMALWTFGVAWAHFMSEWWIFKTTRWGKGLAGPAAVSTGTLVWMWLQWDFYVKGGFAA
ncbi:ergosterol biosynthesis protein [Taxawa tesnikishii (nom. ined.)]|nr:ergosterol biosynthesis protein [Dothideales sp. JES 119]